MSRGNEVGSPSNCLLGKQAFPRDEAEPPSNNSAQAFMAPSSFFFEQAACAGMLPAMIIGRLIENALVIHRQKNGPL